MAECRERFLRKVGTVSLERRNDSFNVVIRKKPIDIGMTCLKLRWAGGLMEIVEECINGGEIIIAVIGRDQRVQQDRLFVAAHQMCCETGVKRIGGI